MASQHHIVSSYDQELGHLNDIIHKMGGLAEDQLAQAVTSLVRHDEETAVSIVGSDQKIDDLENEISSLTVRMLALRQPMADDLRNIVSAIKVASDIERIGDYATNIAERAVSLSHYPVVQNLSSITRMGNAVGSMVKEVLDSYGARDAKKAHRVWEIDADIDQIYASVFREFLTYMMEDPRSISTCTHILFVAKNLERIGDHATNIAESVYFLATGEALTGKRPKGGDGIAPVLSAPKRAKKRKPTKKG